MGQVSQLVWHRDNAIAVVDVTFALNVSDGFVGLNVAMLALSVRVCPAEASLHREAITLINGAVSVHATTKRSLRLNITQTDPAKVVAVTPASLCRAFQAFLDGALTRLSLRADRSICVNAACSLETAVVRAAHAARDGESIASVDLADSVTSLADRLSLVCPPGPTPPKVMRLTPAAGHSGTDATVDGAQFHFLI